MVATVERQSCSARRGIRKRGPVATLRDILELKPVVELIEQLEQVARTGRPPSYRPRAMVGVAISQVLFRAPCWTEVLELLCEHSELQRACGIGSRAQVPSQNACYRFAARLRSVPAFAACLRGLVDLIAGLVPGLGRIVAVDATDIPAYVRPGRGASSDPDARWGIRHRTDTRHTEAFFGYKLHLMVDAERQLPIERRLTPGNANDADETMPLFAAAIRGRDWLTPEFALMDRAYDSMEICRDLEEKYGCHPVIPLRAAARDGNGKQDARGRPCCENGLWTWTGTDYERRRSRWACPRKEDATVRCSNGCPASGDGTSRWLEWKDDPRKHKLVPEGTDEFKRLYGKRASVEREFSILKRGFLLGNHRAPNLDCLAVHVDLCLLVRLATAALSVMDS